MPRHLAAPSANRSIGLTLLILLELYFIKNLKCSIMTQKCKFNGFFSKNEPKLFYY